MSQPVPSDARKEVNTLTNPNRLSPVLMLGIALMGCHAKTATQPVKPFTTVLTSSNANPKSIPISTRIDRRP
jgi:hypothetical protein